MAQESAQDILLISKELTRSVKKARDFAKQKSTEQGMNVWDFAGRGVNDVDWRTLLKNFATDGENPDYLEEERGIIENLYWKIFHHKDDYWIFLFTKTKD